MYLISNNIGGTAIFVFLSLLLSMKKKRQQKNKEDFQVPLNTKMKTQVCTWKQTRGAFLDKDGKKIKFISEAWKRLKKSPPHTQINTLKSNNSVYWHTAQNINIETKMPQNDWVEESEPLVYCPYYFFLSHRLLDWRINSESGKISKIATHPQKILVREWMFLLDLNGKPDLDV